MCISTPPKTGRTAQMGCIIDFMYSCLPMTKHTTFKILACCPGFGWEGGSWPALLKTAAHRAQHSAPNPLGKKSSVQKKSEIFLTDRQKSRKLPLTPNQASKWHPWGQVIGATCNCLPVCSNAKPKSWGRGFGPSLGYRLGGGLLLRGGLLLGGRLLLGGGRRALGFCGPPCCV